MALTYSCILPASPEEVFRLTQDFEALVRISSSLASARKLEPGPIKPGDRVELVVREGRRENKVVNTILEINGEGPVYSDLSECRPALGLRILAGSRAEPTRTGTKFTVEYEIQPTSPLGWPIWLVSRLWAPLAYERHTDCWFKELAGELERRRQDRPGA